MKPPGGNANLGAQTEFAAIGKLGRGVGHDDGAVDFGQESLGRFGILGNDRFGMVRGMTLDMGQRGIEPIDHRNAEDRVEIFAVPVLRAGRLDARIKRAGPGIAAQFAAGIKQVGHYRRRIGKARIKQQRFHRPAHTGAAQLGVERDGPRLGRIGGGMDVAVIDPVQMGQHRHPRIGLDPCHQALAPARHDHINQPGGGQHCADCSAVLRRDQLHCLGRNPLGGEPCDHRGVDGVIGMDRLGAAAQQHGIARADTQCRCIGGYVGAAFIDDPDQPDRYADPRQGKAIGPSCAVDYLTDRIGQNRDLCHAVRHRREPRGIEPEPVEQRIAEAPSRASCHIAHIGRENRRSSCAQGSGRRNQRCGFLFVAQPREHALGCPASVGEPRDQRFGAFGGEVLRGHADGPSSPAQVCQRMLIRPGIGLHGSEIAHKKRFVP